MVEAEQGVTSVRDADGRLWSGVVRGSGRPVLFLHGLGSNGRAWLPLIEQVNVARTFITVDVPGIALGSIDGPPATLLGLIAGLEQFIHETVEPRVGADHGFDIVSHSFGATLALSYVQIYQPPYVTLTMIAPGGFGPEVNPALRLLARPSGQRILGALQLPWSRRAVMWVADAIVTRRPEQAKQVTYAVETYTQLSDREHRKNFRESVRWVLDMNTPDARSSAGRVDPSVPLLILWGGDDQVLPSWQLVRAAERMPSARTRAIDGAGHTPHRSHAREVAAQLIHFWSRPDPVTDSSNIVGAPPFAGDE